MHSISFENRDILVHVYQLNQDEMAQEADAGEDYAAYQHWVLPNREFAGLWDRYVCFVSLASVWVAA